MAKQTKQVKDFSQNAVVKAARALESATVDSDFIIKKYAVVRQQLLGWCRDNEFACYKMHDALWLIDHESFKLFWNSRNTSRTQIATLQEQNEALKAELEKMKQAQRAAQQ